jgi:lipoate-protein ligase A
VPQGPGIVNLSLAWPVYHSLGEAAEPIYLFLCGLLQRTLASFGVASHCRAVSGSFCDGRYNLACGEGEQVRKIAGTAQYWRPMAEGRGHVVLAHAVVLLDADWRRLTGRPMISKPGLAAGGNTAPIKP